MEDDKREATESLPVSEQTTELTDLHHYALLAICEKIQDFNSQMAFAKSYGDAMEIFVNHVWKYQPNRLEVGPGVTAVRLNTREQHFFLAKCMRKHITTFASRPKIMFPKGLEGYLQRLSAVGVKEFPNAKLCILNRPGTIPDVMLLKLTKLMPNITILKLTNQHVSGRHLSKFEQLEEVYLEHVNIKSVFITALLKSHTRLHTLDIHNHRLFQFGSFQAPFLQVLRLNSDTAQTMMPAIMELPNLRELEVRYCYNAHVFETTAQYHDGWPDLIHVGAAQNIFPHVIVTKAAQITSIAINNHGVDLPADWTAELPHFQLPKLKTLVFKNWHHENLFLNGHLRLSNVSHLVIGDCHYVTAETLATLVQKFHELTLLELSQLNIDYHMALKYMENVLKRCERTQPLLVWNRLRLDCLLTNVETAYWRKSKHIRLVADDARIYNRDILGFNVQFDIL